MPAPPSMKYCPDCNAPNPQARTECFACKQSLDTKDAPSPLDERTYPCANCGALIPFAALFCPSCGRSLQKIPPADVPPSSAPASAPPKTSPLPAAARMPPGWEAEPLPDGTVLLRRTTGGKLLRDAGLPVALLFGAALLASLAGLAGSSGNGFLAGFLGLVGVLLLLGFVALLVWGFASREELRIGAKFAAHRQYLGTFERTWRVEGQANLRVSTHKSGMDLGHYAAEKQTRKLWAEHGAQSRPLEQHTPDAKQYGMQWRTGAGILSDAMGGHGDDATVLMARYVSAQTGWPVWDDQVNTGPPPPR